MESIYDLIRRHEGLRLKPYRCPAGKLTIGYGRNLEDAGITKDEAEMMLANDVNRAELDVRDAVHPMKLKGDFTVKRYMALVSMRFQLGLGGFLGFGKMLSAVRNREWIRAADEMLNSRWAEQTPERAKELASMMRDG